MRILRVNLIGIKGRFTTLSGIANNRHMYELSSRLRLIEGVKVTVTEIPALAGVSPALSYAVKSATLDYAGFDIVHNIDIPPAFPLRLRSAAFGTFVPDLFPLLQLGKTSSGKPPMPTTRLEIGNIALVAVTRLALRADFVIVPSTLTGGDIHQIGHVRARVFVVNQGIDSRFSAPIPPPRKTARFRVGYIGAFTFRKNVPFAIEAVRMLDSNRFELQLWGRGSSELQSILQSAQGDRRIEYMGPAPEADLVSVYDNFDAFVFPSLHEGFGLPILEAQARGLPVVVWTHGRIPTEVKRYCFTVESSVEMAETLSKLSTDGYDPELKERAMEYARSFTWEKMARETLDAYAQVTR